MIFDLKVMATLMMCGLIGGVTLSAVMFVLNSLVMKLLAWVDDYESEPTNHLENFLFWAWRVEAHTKKRHARGIHTYWEYTHPFLGYADYKKQIDFGGPTVMATAIIFGLLPLFINFWPAGIALAVGVGLLFSVRGLKRIQKKFKSHTEDKDIHGKPKGSSEEDL